MTNRKQDILLGAALLAVILAAAAFVIVALSLNNNETGAAPYQIEMQQGVPIKDGVVADCELRFNDNGISDVNADPKPGDIIITECRARKPSEPKWNGIGQEF